MDKDQVTSKPEPTSAATNEFDLESVYANNTRFEASVWDLRILFGQLEQHTGKENVDWHTAVTLPWMQVKILVYYLRLNLAFHELQNGPVGVHPNVRPQPLVEPTAEDVQRLGLLAQQLYEAGSILHKEMFGEVPT